MSDELSEQPWAPPRRVCRVPLNIAAAPKLTDLIADSEWMDRAACRGSDLNFFDPRGDDLARSIAKCNGCAVLDDCAASTLRPIDAVERRLRLFGVWAGRLIVDGKDVTDKALRVKVADFELSAPHYVRGIA